MTFRPPNRVWPLPSHPHWLVQLVLDHPALAATRLVEVVTDLTYQDGKLLYSPFMLPSPISMPE